MWRRRLNVRAPCGHYRCDGSTSSRRAPALSGLTTNRQALAVQGQWSAGRSTTSPGLYIINCQTALCRDSKKWNASLGVDKKPEFGDTQELQHATPEFVGRLYRGADRRKHSIALKGDPVWTDGTKPVFLGVRPEWVQRCRACALHCCFRASGKTVKCFVAAFLSLTCLPRTPEHFVPARPR